MKTSKLSIFALMTLGGLLAFGPIAGAQDQPSPSTPPPGGPRGGRPSMEKIIEQLKLTDDQTEKVKPILKDQAEQIKAVRGDTTLTRQEKQPKMKEIREATNAKLKTILTDDQFAQWQKMTKMGGRHKPKANNPPADAPTPPPAAPPTTSTNN